MIQVPSPKKVTPLHLRSSGITLEIGRWVCVLMNAAARVPLSISVSGPCDEVQRYWLGVVGSIRGTVVSVSGTRHEAPRLAGDAHDDTPSRTVTTTVAPVPPALCATPKRAPST